MSPERVIVVDFDGRTNKLVCENRDVYLIMSEMTRHGRIPTYQEAEAELRLRRGERDEEW